MFDRAGLLLVASEAPGSCFQIPRMKLITALEDLQPPKEDFAGKGRQVVTCFMETHQSKP